MTEKELTKLGQKCCDLLFEGAQTKRELLNIVIGLYDTVGKNFINDGVDVNKLVTELNKVIKNIHTRWKNQKEYTFYDA